MTSILRPIPTTAFCLRLPLDLHVRLKTIATLRRMSANALICQALEVWADVLERDYQRYGDPLHAHHHSGGDYDAPAPAATGPKPRYHSAITKRPKSDTPSRHKPTTRPSAKSRLR